MSTHSSKCAVIYSFRLNIRPAAFCGGTYFKRLPVKGQALFYVCGRYFACIYRLFYKKYGIEKMVLIWYNTLYNFFICLTTKTDSVANVVVAGERYILFYG